jgi:anti-sigma factor RsiW
MIEGKGGRDTAACVAPAEIEPGDLTACLDGSASPAVAAHVSRCAFCAAEVERLRETDALLAAALYRRDCPSSDDLLLYQANLLGRIERRRIKRHVDGCRQCQEELAQLGAAAQEPASSSLMDQAAQAARRVLTAVLAPPPLAPALAVRAGEAPGARDKRRLECRAEGYALSLVVIPLAAGEAFARIEGEVLLDGAPAPRGGAVRLLRADGAAAAEDEVDEFGFFHLEGLARGRYAMQVELPGVVVRIEELDLP